MSTFPVEEPVAAANAVGMDESTEVKLIQTIYDRIFDIVTYTPGGGKAPVFDPKTTFVQVVPLGMPINPKDMADAASPINPNGSLLSAEMFFDLLDPAPLLDANYTQSATGISQIYRNIMLGANATETPDPKALELYNQAYNYLNQTTKVKDFTGKETTQVTPSTIYQAYLNNQQAYMASLSAYRTAFNNYDLTDPVQQRQWQANAPVLQNAVTQSWNTWRMQGADQVEQALAAMSTSINSAVRSILEQDKAAFSQMQMAPQVTGGGPWYMTYGMPSNWADPTSGNVWAKFQLSTKYLNTSSDSKFTQYGGGAGYNAGLWSVGGSFNHTEGATQSHTDATDLNINMEICVVQIRRPWFDGSILNMGGWSMGDAYAKGAIATGNLDTATVQTAMPLLPTGFIVARNIQISGNWSAQDQSHIESATSGSTSVGWGPFQISGSYSTSSSHDTFQSSFQDGGLSIPGMQIIAVINQVTPLCPPE